MGYRSPGRKGPCRSLEGEEETEVPSEANTVDADLVPEKAESYAPKRRGPLTCAFLGIRDNIGYTISAKSRKKWAADSYHAKIFQYGRA